MPATIATTFDLIREFYLDGFLAAVIVGLVAPWLGTLLVARRMPFFAIAVPQLSGCGVALVWFLYPLLTPAVGDALHPTDAPLPPQALQLVGSAVVLATGMAILSFLGRGERETGLLAAVVYLLALGLTELLYVESAYEELAGSRLGGGRLLTVSPEGLRLVAIAGVLLVVVSVAARRTLWRTAFDPDLARLQGHSPARGLLMTLLLVGTLSALSVPVVGPEVILAALLIPPAILVRCAPSLRSFAPLSSLAGFLGAVGSFGVAVQKDWPVGPSFVLSTLVATLVVAAGAWIVGRLLSGRQ